MSIVAKIWTEDELLALEKDGKYELVNGELVSMAPAGGSHGRCLIRLILKLGAFVEDNNLGSVYEGQTGFWMKSGNVRVPDISFVAAADDTGVPAGFVKDTISLAIEVLSPDERAGDLQSKLADYFESGVKLVWVINPRTKTVRVFRSTQKEALLGLDDVLSGEDVVPGFSIKISAIF